MEQAFNEWKALSTWDTSRQNLGQVFLARLGGPGLDGGLQGTHLRSIKTWANRELGNKGIAFIWL